MGYVMETSLFAVALLICMLLLLEVGRRVGRRRMEQDTEGARAELGAVDGAVFALLGLLIAFTFLDMEFPRFGLIRVDAFDQALIDVRASMQ